MEINKRNRIELKSYFVKNAIPTESNFADFIDAMLNQKDDGIVKLPGDPLSIEAAGDDTSQKKVINFYQNLTDLNPSWVLSLNPRSDLSKPETARLGFNISDGEGNSRLFIDRSSGNVGIGTTNPGAKFAIVGIKSGERGFEVLGEVGNSHIPWADGQIYLTGDISEKATGKGNLVFRTFDGKKHSHKVVIEGTTGNVGIGTTNPGSYKLSIGETGGQNALHLASDFGLLGDSKLNLIKFGNDGDYQILHKASGAFKRNTLAMHVHQNDAFGVYSSGWSPLIEVKGGSGDLYVKGNVGIGTSNPGAKLEVAGDVKITGSAIRNADNYGIVQTDQKDWLRVNPYEQYPAIALYKPVAIGTGGLAVGSWHQPPTGEIWAKGGINLGVGDRNTHLKADGAFYRYKGQVYITVDDNLYIRDMGGGIKFHFDTNKGIMQTGRVNAQAKLFEIPHPRKPGFKLVHACVEGPEHAVSYRGEGQLSGGQTVIKLPDYFEALTIKNGRTVQLTPKGAEPYLLSYTHIADGAFKVYGTKPNGIFSWEVKAVRADIEPLEVVVEDEANEVERI